MGPWFTMDVCSKSRLNRIRSQDRPALGESLYRLSCPAVCSVQGDERHKLYVRGKISRYILVYQDISIIGSQALTAFEIFEIGS